MLPNIYLGAEFVWSEIWWPKLLWAEFVMGRVCYGPRCPGIVINGRVCWVMVLIRSPAKAFTMSEYQRIIIRATQL